MKFFKPVVCVGVACVAGSSLATETTPDVIDFSDSIDAMRTYLAAFIATNQASLISLLALFVGIAVVLAILRRVTGM